MQIEEIFISLEGEGKRAGQPAIFIRKNGCNINCSYCDTQYCQAQSSENSKEMSLDDIMEELDKYAWCNKVTFTGGEPLYYSGPGHEEVTNLLRTLKCLNYDVNIETNGSVYIEPFLKYRPNIWFTMDYKCPSSGMEDKMNKDNIRLLDNNDVLKFVVGTKEDLNTMLHIVRTYKPKAQVYVSPVFGKIKLEDIAKYIINNSIHDIKLQVQLHKIIWDPDKRGV